MNRPRLYFDGQADRFSRMRDRITGENDAMLQQEDRREVWKGIVFGVAFYLSMIGALVFALWVRG